MSAVSTHRSVGRNLASDDDDDDDDITYDQHFDAGASAPLVVKRPRDIRTDKTPVSADFRDSGVDETDVDYGDGGPKRQRRVASPPLFGRTVFMAPGIGAGQSTIQVEGFDDGYQREDGLAGVQGKDDSEAYSLKYMREYKKRIDKLEQDPDYHFANRVLGFLNGNVFEILDKDAFQRGVEQSIAQAKEEARKALSRSDTIEQLRKEIAEREKQKSIVDGEVRRLEERSKYWQDAALEYAREKEKAAGLLKGNDKVMSLKDRKGGAQEFSAVPVKQFLTERGITTERGRLFDLMTRVAFMKYGAQGLLNRSFASDIEMAHRSAVSGLFADESIKAKMPQLADVALYLAALQGLVNVRGLLSKVAARVKFPPGSLYAADAEQFAVDAAVLANMVVPNGEVDGQVQGVASFTQISLLFHAHLNKMIKNSGKDASEEINKPVRTDETSQTRRAGKRRMFGQEVDVNVDDVSLQRAALGEKDIFTDVDLEKYKREMFANSQSVKTVAAVQALLRPLFIEGFGSMFFVDASGAEETRLYTESRFPFDEPWLVRSIYTEEGDDAKLFSAADVTASMSSVAAMFAGAWSIVDFTKQEKKYTSKNAFSSVGKPEEATKKMFEILMSRNNQPVDWRRYERHLRDSVAQRTVLPAVVRLLLLMHDNVRMPSDGGERLVLFTDADLSALERYRVQTDDTTPGARQTVANSALQIFDTRLQPSSGGAAAATAVATSASATVDEKPNGVLYTSSNRTFDTLVTKKLDGPKFPVPGELDARKKRAAELLEQFREKLNGILAKDPKQVEAEILANFMPGSGVTRRQASLPWNSGILVLSARFNSCLADATDLVRRQCRNLASLDDEELQRDARTIVPFAKLVAHKILLVNAQNPGQYLRDNTIPDLNTMLRSDIEALRSIAPQRSLCSGGGGGFGQPMQRGAGGYARNYLPLARDGQFFG